MKSNSSAASPVLRLLEGASHAGVPNRSCAHCRHGDHRLPGMAEHSAHRVVDPTANTVYVKTHRASRIPVGNTQLIVFADN